MIFQLFDVINRNHSAAKISKVMSSNVHRIYKKTGKTIGQKTKKIFCLRRVNKKVIELCGNCFQQIILGHWL